MRKKLTLSAASLALAFSSYAQLSGVKTINPAGSGADNYASFSAAVTALQAAGVNGSVTFNVAPGVYQERFTIDSAATAGSSATNQIIFQKDPAATGDVFVRPNTTGSTIINLYSASWVTLDGINLEDGGNAAGIGVTNRGMQISGAQYCTLKNFTIRMNSRGQLLNAASRGIASATSFSGAKRAMRYNKFDNLRIVSAGNRAFSLFSDFGSSATNVEDRDRGNVVTNCHIDSIGGGASGAPASCLVAFFLEQDSLIFKNNRITNILHQPTASITLSVLQVSSNPDEVHTRGPVVENNIIGSIVDGGTPSFISDALDGMVLARTDGAIVRNNIVSDFESNEVLGLFSFENKNLLFENNILRSITSLTADNQCIVSGGDSAATFKSNKIANIKSDSPDGATDVIGIDVQNGVEVNVWGNMIDSVYASDLSEGPAAVGIRVSAAISSDIHPEGGKTNVSNNFVSNVYQQNADLDPAGSTLAFGIRSINFQDADANPASGGQQNIAHNTIVLSRPESAPVAHATIGALLFSSDDDDIDAITFTNNILINRNSHPDNADTSFVMQFLGNTENFMAMGNNYVGHNGADVFFAADTASIFPFFADWKAAGYDAMMTTGLMSDTISVTFANEADGDLHVSEADYANAGLRRTPVSWVAKDIDGTDRASGDTQVGADAQVGEQNLLTSVKNNLKSAKSLVVFPNPAREDARFAMNVTKATTATITVRNLMGQTVATKNVNLNAGANTAGINVANLSSGIYVYTVAAEGNVFTGKFIKE